MDGQKKTVIACEALRLEMEKVLAGSGVELMLAEVALHRYPPQMPARLNELIRQAEANGAGEVILGYGLCSHGVNGLLSRRSSLRIARCHDCLGLLLGSSARHRQVLAKWPGALYMFAGLVDAAFDPLSVLERDHIPRMGEKKAWRAMELTFKNYTHFAYIENQVTANPKYKKRYLENCRAFGKEPLSINADLEYFVRLVSSIDRSSEAFIDLAAGEPLTSEAFLNYEPSST